MLVKLPNYSLLSPVAYLCLFLQLTIIVIQTEKLIQLAQHPNSFDLAFRVDECLYQISYRAGTNKTSFISIIEFKALFR